MDKIYKGTLSDIGVSVAFAFTGILRLFVQCTNNFTTIENVLNIAFVILTFIISARFIIIYNKCVIITDEFMVITEMIGTTKIPLKALKRTLLDKKKLKIYLNDDTEVRFQINDLRESDRRDFMHQLSEQIEINEKNAKEIN